MRDSPRHGAASQVRCSGAAKLGAQRVPVPVIVSTSHLDAPPSYSRLFIQVCPIWTSHPSVPISTSHLNVPLLDFSSVCPLLFSTSHLNVPLAGLLMRLRPVLSVLKQSSFPSFSFPTFPFSLSPAAPALVLPSCSPAPTPSSSSSAPFIPPRACCCSSGISAGHERVVFAVDGDGGFVGGAIQLHRRERRYLHQLPRCDLFARERSDR